MRMVDFKKIEQKWQTRWTSAHIFEPRPGKRKKFFITTPYPYMNGAPHIGHAFTFLRADVYARYKRMQQYNVLFPFAFHATGEPVVGVVERLRNGDDAQRETLAQSGATDRDIKRFMRDPRFLVEFFMARWQRDLHAAGLSVDWTRTFVTTDLTPTYSRFIEWQYTTLKKQGRVVQGTHPVVWCPKDASPTGDHDRLYGEGESPQEYILVKFLMDDIVVPCGTLRPETIYGVTNIWVRDGAEYRVARVNGEKWLLSERAAQKLADQLKTVDVTGVVSAASLLGKHCINPMTKKEVPILPASFVDLDSVTGVVMSVPAHAPLDWIALRQLIDADELERFGVSKNDVEPMSVVRLTGGDESSAITLVQKRAITSLAQVTDVQKATADLYKKEFYEGVLTEACGQYAGLTVAQAKDRIAGDLQRIGVADTFWDVQGVVCRCTSPCHVKILENQWFLQYSDETWKKDARACIDHMTIHPVEARQNLVNTLAWLKDKACARKSGLGTRIPWDTSWIVETLSDSTIYMAYYTFSRLLREKKIPAKQLHNSVFDYVLLGRGSVTAVAKETHLSATVLKAMREQFSYFYPVDMRVSGKDLIQNHFLFFILHHVALWKRDRWPRGISVNGYVNVEGEKMSKSRGNMVTLDSALSAYGADLTRLNIVGSTEGLDDADWRAENVRGYRSRLEFLHDLAKSCRRAKPRQEVLLDRYLRSRISAHATDCLRAYDTFAFRAALQHGLFEITNELRWYVKRCGSVEKARRQTLAAALETAVALLAPAAPHIAEELWSLLGKKEFVCVAELPQQKKTDRDENAERAEVFLKQLLSDVQEIQKILHKEKLSLVTVFVAPQWKFVLRENVQQRRTSLGDAIRTHGKGSEERIRYLHHLYKIPTVSTVLPQEDQLRVLGDARHFLEEQLRAPLVIDGAERSSEKKARSATPDKPAVLVQ